MWWHDEEYPSIRKRKNTRKRSFRSPILVVNARIKEQRKIWRQRWSSVFIITLSVAAIAWLLLMGTQSLGRLLFSRNDRFLISELVIESDGSLVTPRLIKGWGGISEGMNLFDVDISAVQTKLENQVPAIETVTIRRYLPDRLVVDVRERQALAQLGQAKYGRIPLAIDREGYVLGANARSPHLPTVLGYREAGLRPGSFVDSTRMQQVLNVLNVCDTTQLGKYLSIQSISIDDPDYLDITLKDGARVLLAPVDMTQRLRKVAVLLQTSAQKGLMPQVIDATGENNLSMLPR